MRKAQDLAERVVATAKAQHRKLPASEAKAALVAEMASEILHTKERIAKLDRHLNLCGDRGNVKIQYDFFQMQRMEGNLAANFKEHFD